MLTSRPTWEGELTVRANGYAHLPCHALFYVHPDDRWSATVTIHHRVAMEPGEPVEFEILGIPRRGALTKVIVRGGVYSPTETIVQVESA